jgi:HEAT repeat protein
MVERPPGERSIDPGELLRSALEKIVFFECRVAQLEAELAAARQVAERARADAAVARTREAEAAHALAAERELRAALSLSEADATERVRLLEAERERLMAGLVERARLTGAPAADGTPGPEEGAADLAGFISEMRGELEALREWKEAQLAGRPPAPLAARPAAAPHASVDVLAGGFSAGGRTGLTPVDTAQLKAFLTTHADQVLWERAMADLSAPEVASRLRAIRQLEALGARAAAPLLATALGRETEGAVKVELLRALARFAEPFAAGLAARELSDPRPEVRSEALQALAAVAEHEAAPHLLRGLGDRSPLVRRRAAVLLGTACGEQVEAALVAALRDADAGVARTAAAALGGRGGDEVQRALARWTAARKVRQAAEAGAGPADGPSEAARRIAARLAEGAAPVAAKAAPGSTASPTVASAAPVRPVSPGSSPLPAGERAAPRGPASAPARAARAAVAVLEAAPEPAPQPAGPAGAALEEAVRLEVRGALRGLGTDDLVRATGAPRARVEAALEVLAVRGAVTLRNTRWWMT